MSIARVTMLEFFTEEDLVNCEESYLKIREEAFPSAELIVNLRTGPTSAMSLAVYPSFESAAGNLEARQKWHESLKSTLKETFYYEGEVTFTHSKNAN